MIDKELEALKTIACNPASSLPELRRVALVSLGELSMLRIEFARYRESTVYIPAKKEFAA